jgi:sialidase-1
VFVSGKDGYHINRIPSLLVTKEGMLLASCEGRKHSSSDRGDIDMLVKRSQNLERAASNLGRRKQHVRQSLCGGG